MKRVLKWIGITFGTVAGVLLLAVGTVYMLSERRFRRTYEVRATPVAVRTDSATIAQGRHWAEVRGCMDCHGMDLAGTTMADDPVFGRLRAPNLTMGEGGAARRFGDADWDRAVRHGVRADGTPLYMMPSKEYASLSDEELDAIVAYVRSAPPVNTPVVHSTVGPLGRALFLAGQLPLLPAEQIAHDAPHPATVERGVSEAYGKYLAATCMGCHGENLAGSTGGPPGAPPASNLTPDSTSGLGRWTEADFITALRTGKRPDGRTLDDAMPWKALGKMTDDELRAVYLYLRSLPPTAAGQQAD